MADVELKKAFTELKNKTTETASRIKGVDTQVEQCKNRGKHAELTYAEIRNAPADTKLYESVGRIPRPRPSQRQNITYSQDQDPLKGKMLPILKTKTLSKAKRYLPDQDPLKGKMLPKGPRSSQKFQTFKP
eukprot:sb/3475094/